MLPQRAAQLGPSGAQQLGAQSFFRKLKRPASAELVLIQQTSNAADIENHFIVVSPETRVGQGGNSNADDLATRSICNTSGHCFSHQKLHLIRVPPDGAAGRNWLLHPTFPSGVGEGIAEFLEESLFP